jgi:alpha-glucuronidase
MLKKIGFPFGVGIALVAGTVHAQTAGQAWLKYPSSTDREIEPLPVRSLGRSPLELSAVQELTRSNMGFTDLPNPRLPANSALVLGNSLEVSKSFPQLHVPGKLGPDGYWLTHVTVRGDPVVVVAGADDRGVLYGAFALLRRLRQGELIYPVDVQEQPAMPIRWVDEWDNADGSIERGYAGRSIFFEGGKVREDLAPVGEYARLLASVGINGCNINNVNNAAAFLDPEMLKGVARISEAMRPWGVRLALSVDIASPQKIGGLASYDPLDPAVKAWWAAKVNEIYALIPDFAGFTVKADSEGQPGPASYGRTPADAANLLAGALQPHGGVVLYRAFVYNHHLDWRDPKADRARAAYDIFHPLDGKFAANVIVQTKEGPIDFQAREPVSPLFAGLEKTSQAMEVQITQEYTGQQRHLVYLAPMWKQVLDFDMRAGGRATPVKEILEGHRFNQPLGGMVGVAGVGREAWLGSPLAMANLYAFGRLAWNPDLTPEQIADEWIRQTIGTDPEVVSTVRKMLMQSWPAYERYTGPLGMQTLTDITGSHYGPNIESSENNGWGQWHRADHEGVGMDRSVATGTGFAGQYPPEVAAMYEKPATTSDNLLLFFHHVPYTYKLQDGKTVIQYIFDSHYQGAAEAAELGTEWATLKGRIDPALFDDVRTRLEYQAGHAIVWRDAIVQYFLKLSGIADERGRAGHYPGRLEAEDARLTGYKVIDVTPWEDASGGKAVSCQGTTSQPAEKVVRAVGRGFIPGISDAMSTRALAPEVCFWETSLETMPFSAASSVVPNTPERNDGASAPEGQPACSAAWTYSGQPGRFDIAVQYFDLQGGAAKFNLNVNGQTISTWSADGALPSKRPHGDNSTRFTARGVALKPGDVIRVEGMPDGSDPAALDYIEVAHAAAQPD